MTHAPVPAKPSEVLTAVARDRLRRAFCVRFGSPPRLADDVHRRGWRSDPRVGWATLGSAEPKGRTGA